ncbi:hypothetical protein MN608_10387 [Microdochium nivale]|nr:hypothetical protein MN608_10387 [Microdochium nivale]
MSSFETSRKPAPLRPGHIKRPGKLLGVGFRKTPLRKSITVHYNSDDDDTNDEEWSPSLVTATQKRHNPPSPILGHEPIAKKRLIVVTDPRRAAPASGMSPASSRSSNDSSVPGSKTLGTATARKQPQFDKALTNGTPSQATASTVQTTPEGAALLSENATLRDQLLRARGIDLFSAKNKLAGTVRELEKARHENRRLKAVIATSHVSWHVVQNAYPQVTRLLRIEPTRLIELYDLCAAHQVRLSALDGVQRRNALFSLEELVQDYLSDEPAVAFSKDIGAAATRTQGALTNELFSRILSDTEESPAASIAPRSRYLPESAESLTSRIHNTLLSHPCGLPNVGAHTSGNSIPSGNKLTHPVLITTKSTGTQTLLPIVAGQTRAGEAASSLKNTASDDFLDLIAHIERLPDKAPRSLSCPCASQATTSEEIRSSDGYSSAAQPAATNHSPGDRPALAVGVDQTQQTGDASLLRAQNVRLQEHNRQLRRRVRVLLNQQAGCGF